MASRDASSEIRYAISAEVFYRIASAEKLRTPLEQHDRGIDIYVGMISEDGTLSRRNFVCSIMPFTVYKTMPTVGVRFGLSPECAAPVVQETRPAFA
ncbi:MAG TPA: hypothetical protein VEC13_02630 [Candidatus Paceibacterota bacterium]|nr:hypothetical protein [Candidatus Paceibacterota bacterium]